MMTPDEQTPCPFCPALVRGLYTTARRVLERERQYATPEYEELAAVVEALQPYYAAHYADQRHAFSELLEDARYPVVAPPLPRPLLDLLAREAS